MAERLVGREARPALGLEGRSAVPDNSGSAGDRKGRSRWPLWARILAGMVGAGLAAYGALWMDLPLRRTLAETVLTSQHYKWAALLATPGELRQWQKPWAKTPDVQVVTAAPVTVPVAQHPAPVTVTPITGPTYHGFLVSVPDASRIIVGTSQYLGRYGERPSAMGARYGADLAVNGGGFMDPNGEGYGGAPIGVTLAEGRVVPADPDDGSDYVIGFDLRNRLVVGKWDIAQSRALGIRDAVSFKPLLVAGGRGLITQGDGGWGLGPRTAIGQKADGTVLFVVIDGRQAGSLGATLREVQDILLGAGAVTAANLDGGSSTVLWQNGKVLNHPSSPFGERPVPTAFLVMPTGFNADQVARPNLRADAQVPAIPGPISPPIPPPQAVSDTCASVTAPVGASPGASTGSPGAGTGATGGAASATSSSRSSAATPTGTSASSSTTAARGTSATSVRSASSPAASAAPGGPCAGAASASASEAHASGTAASGSRGTPSKSSVTSAQGAGVPGSKTTAG